MFHFRENVLFGFLFMFICAIIISFICALIISIIFFIFDYFQNNKKIQKNDTNLKNINDNKNDLEKKYSFYCRRCGFDLDYYTKACPNCGSTKKEEITKYGV